jgi:hypothetical protein
MRDRVLIEIGVHRRLGGLLEEGRSGEIGESLPQVDGAMLIRQPAHFTEHRGAKTSHARRSYLPGQIRSASIRSLAPGSIITSV